MKWFSVLLIIVIPIFLVCSASVLEDEGNNAPLDELMRALDFGCTACRRVLDKMHELLATGMNEAELIDYALDVCTNLTNVVSYTVCSGAVNLMGPEVIYIANYSGMSSHMTCSFLTHGDHCNSSMPDFTIEVPGGKPPVSDVVPIEGPATIKILHISDPHVDLQYQENTPEQCDKGLLCCRASNTSVGPDEPLAGHWGSYGECDLPIWTLELMLEQAALLDPDIIYLTGDHPPHDAWMQTREANLAAISRVNQAFFNAFPNTLILQSLGNHETVPVNSYPVPEVYEDGWDIRWLYNYLADTWVQGGIPAQSLDTVRTGGYYTYSPMPGLRVVAVNMNYCYTWNWWLLMDNADPTGQLAWLVDVLSQAEQAGEKVHILDHISTGSRDCDAIWSHQINRIYSRFESTIAAIFSGHHHCDQFRMLWDVDSNTRPVGLAYLAPSASSLGRKNPAFRIFTIDGGYPNATWAPLNHETYTLNLTEANSGADAEFKLTYSAKAAYGISDLTPSTWAQLGWNMTSDETLFYEYLRHYFNYAADPDELTTCDVDCKKSLLCEIYRGDSSDREPCERIMAEVDQNTLP